MAGAADDVLDVAPDVVVLARPGGLSRGGSERRSAVVGQVIDGDDEVGAGLAVVSRVDASSAVEDVGAGPADEDVVGITTAQAIVAGIAAELIVPAAAANHVVPRPAVECVIAAGAGDAVIAVAAADVFDIDADVVALAGPRGLGVGCRRRWHAVV